MMMSDPGSLCAEVAKAFDSVPQPGDMDLVPGGANADPMGVDVVITFRGKKWRSVTKEDVRKHCDDLALMTPRAFLYFLPAYMSWCVRVPRGVNNAVTATIGCLIPEGESSALWRWWWDRAELLNLSQAKAVVAFLEYEDACEREDWAAMGKHVPTTIATEALPWWHERVETLSQQL